MKKRNLPSLRLLIGLGVVLSAIYFGSIILSDEKTDGFELEYNKGVVFNLFENAPLQSLSGVTSVNQFSVCKIYQDLYYHDENGVKRRGDLAFIESVPIVGFDVKSRFSGVTIDKFSVDIFAICNNEDAFKALTPLLTKGDIVINVYSDNSDGRSINTFSKRVFVDIEKERFSQAVLDLSEKTKLKTIEISADEIESALNDNTESFRSHHRIITDVLLTLKFKDSGTQVWNAGGRIETGYKTIIENENNCFRCHVKPESTDIELNIVNPTNGFLNSNRQLHVIAEFPEWKSTEGLPTLRIAHQSNPSIDLVNIKLAVTDSSSSNVKFEKRLIIPSSQEGNYKISVSLDKRNTATGYVQYTEDGGGNGGTNGGTNGGNNGGNNNPNVTICSVPEGVDITPIIFLEDCLGIDLGDCNGRLMFGFLCTPEFIAWWFDDFRWFWALTGLFVFAILIKILRKASSGNKNG